MNPHSSARSVRPALLVVSWFSLETPPVSRSNRDGACDARDGPLAQFMRIEVAHNLVCR